MKLELVAPFRVHFNLNDSKVIAEEEAFAQFFKELAVVAKEPDFMLAEASHLKFVINDASSIVESDARYVSLDEAGSYLSSLRYVKFYLPDQPYYEEKAKAAFVYASRKCGVDFSEHLTVDWSSLHVTVYDNTVAILDVSLDLDKAHKEWAGLSEWSTFFVSELLNSVYPEEIFPVLKNIYRFAQSNGAQGFIRNPKDYVVNLDINDIDYNDDNSVPEGCKLLWVSRTLVTNKKYTIDGWLPSDVKEEDAMVIPRGKAYLGVGNNLIVLEKDYSESDVMQLWSGMFVAQYYYAVLDILSHNLKPFIGRSYFKLSSKEVKKLSEDMEQVVGAVTIVLVCYNDVYMELQGIAQNAFQRFEKSWEVRKLFDNVQEKTDLCHASMDNLNSLIGQHSDLRLQLVLTLVAGLGIVQFMLNIAIYNGKNSESDPIPGLLDLGQIMSANSIVWVGIVLAFMVVFYTFINKLR